MKNVSQWIHHRWVKYDVRITSYHRQSRGNDLKSRNWFLKLDLYFQPYYPHRSFQHIIHVDPYYHRSLRLQVWKNSKSQMLGAGSRRVDVMSDFFLEAYCMFFLCARKVETDISYHHWTRRKNCSWILSWSSLYNNLYNNLTKVPIGNGCIKKFGRSFESIWLTWNYN